MKSHEQRDAALGAGAKRDGDGAARPLILFVCTGNVCRSPMAAALFAARAQRAGDYERFRIASVGTWALEDEPATQLAQAMMRTRGLSLDAHRARTVTAELLNDAALIIVMTRSHKEMLAAEFPNVRSRIRLVSELAGPQYDIADPYGRGERDYAACADELERLIETGYARVLEWLTPAFAVSAQ